MFGSVMVPGEMVIEEVHGLNCTNISLNDRFTMSTAEYLGRIARLRKRRTLFQSPRIKWFVPNLMTQRLKQQLTRRQPIKQRLGMPALRRFGSDGNLPGLRRSNSVGQLNKMTRWTPFNRSRSVSRAGSVDNMSNASWHGRTGYVRRRGNFGQLRGRLRGGQQNRQQFGQKNRLRNRAGGRGRGRGGIYRNQQNRKQINNQNENKPNNQQNNQQKFNNRNKPLKLLTKEELDAQLDQYMALSEKALDKELEDYMMKGALMEIE